jgi:hypothetical protein
MNPQEEKPKIEWDKSMHASNNLGMIQLHQAVICVVHIREVY